MVLLDITKKDNFAMGNFDNKNSVKVNSDVYSSNKNKSLQTQSSTNSVNEHFYFSKDLSSGATGFILAISLFVIFMHIVAMIMI